MKSLTEYIRESKAITFLTADKNDPRANVTWTEGEPVFIVKYDEHHYRASHWNVSTIKKVNKASIIIDTDNEYVNKFDKNGILKKHTKNKYLGTYDTYWVLYNKSLIDSSDINELVNKGTNSWGFKFANDEDKKNFTKEVKAFKKVN